jgi:hypothetical protein
MAAMLRMLLFCLPFVCLTAYADISGCSCVPGSPEISRDRTCSLTLESLKQPSGTSVFILKDNNPRKPNRWLALPGGTGPAAMFIEKMRQERRAELWRAALAKAREMFGEQWGLAVNGPRVRTQCQMHIHIGKFAAAAENRKFLVVNRIEDVPLRPEDGLFVHGAGDKIHVHYGEQTTETALMK